MHCYTCWWYRLMCHHNFVTNIATMSDYQVGSLTIGSPWATLGPHWYTVTGTYAHVCVRCVCVCVCVCVSAPTTQTYVIVYVPKYLNNQKIFFLQVAVSTSILIFTSVTVREKRFQALCVLVFDFDFFAYDNDSRKFFGARVDLKVCRNNVIFINFNCR